MTTNSSDGFRLYYPYKSVRFPYTEELNIYSGTPVQVLGNDAPPAMALQHKPPTVTPDQYVYFDGYGWVVGLNATLLTLQQAQGLLASKLDTKLSQNVRSLSAGYTEQERYTWPFQEADARAYKAGAEATLLLRSLASGQDLRVDALADKVLSKAQIYRDHYAQVLAQYQRARKRVEKATSLDQLPLLTQKDLCTIGLSASNSLLRAM